MFKIEYFKIIDYRFFKPIKMKKKKSFIYIFKIFFNEFSVLKFFL